MIAAAAHRKSFMLVHLADGMIVELYPVSIIETLVLVLDSSDARTYPKIAEIVTTVERAVMAQDGMKGVKVA